MELMNKGVKQNLSPVNMATPSNHNTNECFSVDIKILYSFIFKVAF